jgi:sporulation protein YlmC with PRC-barrel domain
VEVDMNLQKLFSLDVIDTNGYKAGKIVDMNVDVMSGRIQNVIVKTGFMTKKTIGLDKIKNIGDTVILNIKKEELK